MRESLHKMSEKCVDDPMVKITDEMKEKVRKNEHLDEQTEMQMSRCIMMKMGYMNEAGQIMMEKMKETIGSEMRDPTKFDKMMKKCNKMMDEPMMTSRMLMKCISEFQAMECGC